MTGGTVIGKEGRAQIALGAAVGLVALLGGLALGGRADARGAAFELEQVGDFNAPVDVRDAPGEPSLLLVVEKAGKVRVVDDGITLAKPFLNIKKRVSSGGEEGLLSLAFHPNYERNRRFYVFYVNTKPGHDVEVAQYKRQKNSEVRAAKKSRRKTLYVQHNQANNHNGGQLQFEPGTNDLYVSVGDGGPQGDPEDDAQDPGSMLGKLHRITPRGKGGYEVPADNPFVGIAGRDEVYALGLRNPFRFSFDSGSGALTIGDVGGSEREEIDYVAAPAPGLNFGWNDFEGTLETDFGIGADADPHTPPIHEYPNGAGPDAVTGGYVVRDPGLPALAGEHLYADFYDGDLLTLEVPAGTPGTPIGLNVPQLASFGEGLDGQIYVVSLAGDVFRLEQA